MCDACGCGGLCVVWMSLCNQPPATGPGCVLQPCTLASHSPAAHVDTLVCMRAHGQYICMTQDGKTMVMLAARGGHADVVRLLVAELGADKEAKDKVCCACVWGWMCVWGWVGLFNPLY